MRRSVGLPALPAVVLLIVANVMMRDRDWVHEWFWAYFNFHFVSVFLGPLAAGLGAWEGARLAQAGDYLVSSDGVRRALAGVASAVLGWLLGPYLLGLVWISWLVRQAGTPGGPGMIEMSTLIPAVAFLGMWAALGVAAGYRARSPLAAPLATVASFSVILVLYMVDYDLVRVGGATGSLLGLAPRPGVQAAQTALYVAVAVWAVLWSGRWRGVDDRRFASLIVAGIATVLAAGLFVNQGDDFASRPVNLRCEGSPPICLAPGYERDRETVASALNPLLEGLGAVGVPLPKRFVQDYDNVEDLVGSVSNELALGDVSDARYAVVSAYERAWGAKQLTISLFGVFLLGAAWRGPIAVPLRRDVAEIIWPFAFCLLALTIPRVAVRAWDDRERCSPRSGWRRRFGFVAATVVVVLLTSSALALLHPFAVLVRNGLLLTGAGLASTVLLPASIRWVPVSLYPILTWLLGARPAGEPAAGWAVLLHVPGSQVAARVAAVTLLLGAGAYVMADRPLRR